jgi:dipeptidyl-peptidase-4
LLHFTAQSNQEEAPVIRSLLLFICLSQIAFSQSTATQSPVQPKLTIDAIFTEGGITGRAPETVKWSPDGTKVSFIQRDDSGQHSALYYVDVTTGKKAVLVAEEKLATLAPPVSSIKDEREKERIQRYSVAGYHWAPDSKHLLFDAKGQLWLYSLDSGTAVQLTAASDPSTDPKFSIDGRHIAYLRKHNLWVKPVADESERQLTTDKDENVLNGEVDWVYAEELDVRSNYFWSPEGKQIAFLQMNETKVPSYPIEDWIPLNPKVDQEKYPKPGDPNPEVRLGVIASDGGKVKWIEVGQPQDREYIPRFGWVREGMIWVQLLNRAQNKLDLYFVDVRSGKSQRMLSETSDAWVPVTDMFQILASGNAFLWPSWRDGFMQLYLYSFDKANPLVAEAKLERQLTKGQFEVDSVNGVDETAGDVYFVANAGDLIQRQLFAVKLDGTGTMRAISREPGTHGVSMPDTAKYYVDTFSSLALPPRMSLCKLDGACAPFWQANSVEQYNLPVPKRLELKAANRTTTLYGTLLLPPADVIAAHGGKVPLINNPYGGPGAQNVVDKWGGANYFFDVILSRAGFAVLHVDNRGMAGRGREFAAAVKGHFGDTELADQLAAIDQVLAANPVLDRERLGWWGWSYGGYMTTYALTHSNRFKAGIAVAPVTDWQDYDSIYTERYMGLPGENKNGYRNSSTVNSAADLSGRLLLVHGTGDDNVHLQNTIQIIQSLITANKPYDLQLYPRKTHGIAGKAARVHLFERIQAQFMQWLNPQM